MANTWFEKINSIKADEGFVFIYMTDKRVVQMTVDEAVERADAITKMDKEKYSEELAENLMAAAFQAHLQKQDMAKNGVVFDYTTEAVLRRMESKGTGRMLKK